MAEPERDASPEVDAAREIGQILARAYVRLVTKLEENPLAECPPDERPCQPVNRKEAA